MKVSLQCFHGNMQLCTTTLVELDKFDSRRINGFKVLLVKSYLLKQELKLWD